MSEAVYLGKHFYIERSFSQDCCFQALREIYVVDTAFNSRLQRVVCITLYLLFI